MKPRPAALSLVVGALLLATPLESQACACCSEEGQYLLEQGKPSDLQLGEMNHARFAADAQLYVGPGDKEDVKGISEPAYRYHLEASFDDARAEWNLTFRDEAGNSGRLLLPLKGAKMSTFKVDIHDGQKSPGGGPLLYKEWKFVGQPRGTGIFEIGLKSPASFTLVLQGRGNVCDQAGDFSHWRLDVEGPSASFALTGEMMTSTQPATPASGE